MRWTMGLTVLTAVLVVYASCDEDRSPNGPDGNPETVTLRGFLMKNSGHVTNGIMWDPETTLVRITGASIDTLVTVSGTGYYILAGVPPGTYTATPISLSDPELSPIPDSRTVTATPGTTEVDPFFSFTSMLITYLEEHSLGFIGGRISGPDVLRESYKYTVTTAEGDTINNGQFQQYYGEYQGYYRINPVPYGTYRFTPSLDGFVFDPPYRDVTIDSICEIAHFTAEYVGPPRYKISCRIISDALEYTAGMYLSVVVNPMMSCQMYADASGLIESPLLSQAKYHANITCYAQNVPAGEYPFERKTVDVDIIDSDIDLGDIMIRYIGSMYYGITGMVEDAQGNDLQGVTVRIGNYPLAGSPVTDTRTTAADGMYAFSGEKGLASLTDIEITVTPTKTGWSFTPPTAILAHEYVEHLPYLALTADFTGTPVFMASYFPLDPGALWTYAHTADGVPTGTITVEAGASFTAGGETWVPLSGYMFDSFAGYRVDGATLYAWTGQQVRTWATLDELSWDIGTISGYSAAGELLASEGVTVPAGTFADCRIIRITIRPDSPSAEVTTFWLAEGIGPVKVEYTATSGGTVVQRITDELTAYQAP